MIPRRALLIGLAFVGLSRACTRTSSSSLSQAPSTEVSGSLPPHCEALSLVWKTQEEQIKKLELQHAIAQQQKRKEFVGAEGRWWFDTDERRWIVTRPFGPGGVDSTHLFSLSKLNCILCTLG